MAQKPSIPSGMRDFSPLEMSRRKHIFNAIEKVFLRYGFKQIETPAMENLSTLTGKYGDEGDKLLFKVLNSGDFISKASDEALQQKNSNRLLSQISEKGLRYDLTVPFARYVVMHQQEITYPFKRYQIQPVWRADRPQKGRYREFYQCDADIVGSDSLLFEAELAKIYDEVFMALDLQVVIRINNRKILEGIAIEINAADRFRDITVIIDKLDKIGWEKVAEELQTIGIGAEQQEIMKQLLVSRPLNKELVSFLRGHLTNETGKKGIDELEQVIGYLEPMKLQNPVLFDGTLARGLNYYTGIIYEVGAAEGTFTSSIGGGGRYDDLTGIFGLKGISGVGISFGADRIYDVLQDLDRFPEEEGSFTRLLFCPVDEEALLYSIPLVQLCRNAGISAEIYPEPAKLKKQLGYANSNKILYTVVIGETERTTGKLSFKNMISGEQQSLDIEQVITSAKQ